MLHQVLRSFSGGGLSRVRGEAINPDEYRNGRRLIEQRFISQGPVGSAIACGCGRQWVEAIANHDCQKPEAVMLESTETKRPMPSKRAV